MSVLDDLRAAKRLLIENSAKPQEPVKFYAAGPNSAKLARRVFGPSMPIVILPKLPRH